jgi:hypothetical protein
MATVTAIVRKQNDTEYKGNLMIINDTSISYTNWSIKCEVGEGITIDECKNFTITSVDGSTVLEPNEKIKELEEGDKIKSRFSGSGKMPTEFKFVFNDDPPGPDPGPGPGPDPTPVDPPIIPDGAEYLKMDVKDLEVLEVSSSNPWNIVKVGHGSSSKNPELHSIIKIENEDVLQVNYPKGSYRPAKDPKGGIGFYAEPKPIFPSPDYITLSYDLYFADNFDPVKGGKLPGIYIGEPGSSGGNHSTNKASIRMMWRTSKKTNEIDGEVYAYISQKQDASYNNIPGLVLNPRYGNSMWRGFLKFYKLKWNRVCLTVKMNTFNGNKANSDGIIIINVNGVEYSFNKLKYTEDKVNIEGFVLDTFFGGSDSSWATPVSTSIYFKNFVMYKTKDIPKA